MLRQTPGMHLVPFQCGHLELLSVQATRFHNLPSQYTGSCGQNMPHFGGFSRMMPTTMKRGFHHGVRLN